LSDVIKNLLLWLVIALVLMSVFSRFGPQPQTSEQMSYSEFVTKSRNKEIQTVHVKQGDPQITGITKNNERFTTTLPSPPQNQWLDELVTEDGVDVNVKPQEQQSMLMHIFISWFPIILFKGMPFAPKSSIRYTQSWGNEVCTGFFQIWPQI